MAHEWVPQKGHSFLAINSSIHWVCSTLLFHHQFSLGWTGSCALNVGEKEFLQRLAL
jgi:hypothetical protein